MQYILAWFAPVIDYFIGIVTVSRNKFLFYSKQLFGTLESQLYILDGCRGWYYTYQLGSALHKWHQRGRPNQETWIGISW